SGSSKSSRVQILHKREQKERTTEQREQPARHSSKTETSRYFLWGEGAVPERLRHSTAEARAVARLYQCELLLRERATKATVLQQIGKVDVVHLATHGYLVAQSPMYSGLLLTVSAKKPAAGEALAEDE